MLFQMPPIPIMGKAQMTRKLRDMAHPKRNGRILLAEVILAGCDIFLAIVWLEISTVTRNLELSKGFVTAAASVCCEWQLHNLSATVLNAALFQPLLCLLLVRWNLAMSAYALRDCFNRNTSNCLLLFQMSDTGMTRFSTVAGILRHSLDVTDNVLRRNAVVFEIHMRY